MKTTSKVALTLAASGMAILGLTAGCADDGPPPPPPRVAVVGFVPDDCFWDGYEYVGWYGDQYYYWGPEHVWIICDPVRVQRVNVWISDHPHWRTQARPSVQYQVKVAEQPHPSPLRAPTVKRGQDRDHNHNHDYDRDRDRDRSRGHD
ncbi:MAG TPA: hypothetical protein VFF11_10295 [Candidatus Binatia bacterium]|nr:hypothetical protein [Candidatus Binatia bacterium]